MKPTQPVQEERIVGYFALRRDGGVFHLEDLFVRPSEMGRGVGRALFRHAQRRARELGFAFIEVQSDPNAAGFYERMGAERIGTHFTLLDSQRRDLPLFRCHTSDVAEGDCPPQPAPIQIPEKRSG